VSRFSSLLKLKHLLLILATHYWWILGRYVRRLLIRKFGCLYKHLVSLGADHRVLSLVYFRQSRLQLQFLLFLDSWKRRGRKEETVRTLSGMLAESQLVLLRKSSREVWLREGSLVWKGLKGLLTGLGELIRRKRYVVEDQRLSLSLNFFLLMQVLPLGLLRLWRQLRNVAYLRQLKLLTLYLLARLLWFQTYSAAVLQEFLLLLSHDLCFFNAQWLLEGDLVVSEARDLDWCGSEKDGLSEVLDICYLLVGLRQLVQKHSSSFLLWNLFNWQPINTWIFINDLEVVLRFWVHVQPFQRIFLV